MSLRSCYWVMCDQCSASTPESCKSDDVLEALDMAIGAGFVYTKVQNGSFWHFCPKCFLEHQKEIKESSNNSGASWD